MKIWHVYWRGEDRNTHNGFVKAASRDEAYDITQGKLQKGYHVTAVYEGADHQITPQSLTINFPNMTDYYVDPD